MKTKAIAKELRIPAAKVGYIKKLNESSYHMRHHSVELPD